MTDTRPDSGNFEELETLITDAIEGDLSEDQHARLNEILRVQSGAQKHYLQLIRAHAMLEWHHGTVAGLRQARNANECDTPSLTVESEATQRRRPRTVVWALAALLAVGAVVGIALLTSNGPTGASSDEISGGETGIPVPVDVDPIDRPVAMVTDSFDPRWLAGDTDTDVGTTLFSQRRVELAGGRVQLMFNSGAVVDLYGPAVFEVIDDNAGRLSSGRLSAWVPTRAVGFAIEAPDMTVTDLGTEFGLIVEPEARTQLHVFRGEVRADIPALNGRASRSVSLKADEAIALTSLNGVESISSDMSYFPRVQPTLRLVDLGDIVGGGDGSGNGKIRGIRLPDGQPALEHAERLHEPEPNRFIPVANPFIDGVFIPDGGVHGGNRVPITSTDQVVMGLPDTTGLTWDHIWNRPNLRVTDTVLDGVDYSEVGRSLLGFHANKGITFDLDAIRDANHGWTIQRFTSIAGNNFGSVDFIVLVDGRVAFRLMRHIGSPRGVEVDVSLTEDDRFLTLLACDGGDSTGHDWSIWAQPLLTLAPSSR